jgi:hypothetical protein
VQSSSNACGSKFFFLEYARELRIISLIEWETQKNKQTTTEHTALAGGLLTPCPDHKTGNILDVGGFFAQAYPLSNNGCVPPAKGRRNTWVGPKISIYDQKTLRR